MQVTTSKYVTIALHVLVWGAVLVLPYTFSSPENHYVHVGSFRCNFFTLTNIIHIGLFYFNAYYLYSKLFNSRFWWLYVVSVALLILVIYNLKVLILNASFPLLAASQDFFGFTFFPIVVFFVISTVYRLILDKINSEREQLAMELKFLRSQVNPHFLFNVLNNLVSMARHRSEKLEPSLIKLSGLMRYMLFESEVKKIPVQVELEYLTNYINLQELRFDQDVVIQTNFNYDSTAYSIEPMLLIPFVENAFKHGITVLEKPVIKLDLFVKDDSLHFKVMNKFEKGNLSKDMNSGIGLSNVKSRLNLLYAKRHQLSIKKREGIFEVDLRIKLR